MFIKLFYITGTFTHFSIIICINFLRVIFRIFCYFMFAGLFFLVFALLFCVFVSVLHVFYLFTNFNDYNSSSGFTFFHIHANIDKESNYLQSNDSTSSKSFVFFSRTKKLDFKKPVIRFTKFFDLCNLVLNAPSIVYICSYMWITDFLYIMSLIPFQTNKSNLEINKSNY